MKNSPSTNVTDLDSKTTLSLVTDGDCGKLSAEQKLLYYRARCEAAGLDYRTQPFQFLKLQGKTTLYALKAATDQLASKHGIRVEILGQSTDEGIRVVTVRAIARDGRQTDEIGALPIKGLSGDALANGLMKAVTKAKRRAILSLCGLGMMDETETTSIPGAKPEPIAQEPIVIAEAEVVQTPVKIDLPPVGNPTQTEPEPIPEPPQETEGEAADAPDLDWRKPENYWQLSKDHKEFVDQMRGEYGLCSVKQTSFLHGEAKRNNVGIDKAVAILLSHGYASSWEVEKKSVNAIVAEFKGETVEAEKTDTGESKQETPF